MLVKALAITLGVLVAIISIVLLSQPQYIGRRAGAADENYLQSTDCRLCHAGHYASWARTHHSRMTQDAKPETVQGDFTDNNRYEYLGIKADMESRDGKFSMTFQFPDGRSQLVSIDRIVGSRRMEQYLTKQEGQYTRLPLAFDLVNKRWMNLNGSFFYPDSDNYFQHLSQWDGNCVFCHNVKAQPHIDFKTNHFKTEVSELGIACGACHGPGAAHAQAAGSPLTRTLWQLGGNDNKQIVHPLKLTSERSLMVCGHCHGQRLPEPFDRIRTILSEGDPFDAGEDLSEFYRPIFRESHVGNTSFATRFWNNGSPRLTAFEYQGVLRSKCFTAGTPGKRINCLTCHTMHSGDPLGQITDENRGDRPCLSCHPKFSTETELINHTKHRADSTGSRCYNCHMPIAVYGIMTFHPTHEITNPDPELTATEGVPNACNQCHLDRSVNWSIEQTMKLWPTHYAKAHLSNDDQFDLPEGPRALFAGDALVRALAANLLAGNGPHKPDPLWASPFLVEALADNYPIVRFFAANGLTSERMPWRASRPDYLSPPGALQQLLKKWRAIVVSSKVEDREQALFLSIQLKSQRRNVDIEVGE